eukprot:3870582-Rhodomonas_salina.1
MHLPSFPAQFVSGTWLRAFDFALNRTWHSGYEAPRIRQSIASNHCRGRGFMVPEEGRDHLIPVT